MILILKQTDLSHGRASPPLHQPHIDPWSFNLLMTAELGMGRWAGVNQATMLITPHHRPALEMETSRAQRPCVYNA